MHIVFVGGHLAPAMAVLDVIPKNQTISFIGRKYVFEKDDSVSFEYQEITKRNIPFYVLRTGRLQRRVSLSGVVSLSRIPIGFFKARKTLSEIKPDVVLSFGGYLSIPVAFAAKTLGIPIVVHEQTLNAGLANRTISRVVKKICISWDDSKKFFPDDKVVLTGNPLRKIFLKVTKDSKRKRPRIRPMLYVTGGSGGAHFINMLVGKNLNDLLQQYTIVHQTGESKFNDFDRLSGFRSQLPPALKDYYIIKKFLTDEEVADTMQEADLVIGRSGMNTVTELLYLGKAALLIPLQNGQKGEQMDNAIFLKKLGLAEILSEEQADNNFLTMLQAMVKSFNTYKLKDRSYHKRIESAASSIVGEIFNAGTYTKK